MSEGNVEVVRGVRTPVNVRRETTRRSLDERLLLRFPALLRLLGSAWSRLPPRSRLRRAFLSRFIRQALEAANRRDWDVLLLGVDPRIEYRPTPGLRTLGLGDVYRGHDGFLETWKTGIEVMGDVSLECDEVIDFGDRLLTAGRVTAHGDSSGAFVDQPNFQVVTLRHGRVIRQEDFTDRDEALRAAGLSEDADSNSSGSALVAD
jgi:ketosteroid isomerase-like protein